MNENKERFVPNPNEEWSETIMVCGALHRIGAALERLAEVYLYVNTPEDDEEGFTGQSLSDVPS